mmetsp:Transcript_9522/g.23456  ORF Transcript_9522/g.23456 Transcript_9522/m.23456 type:complete len:124 (-) Transcript_9522:427-798(-)
MEEPKAFVNWQAVQKILEKENTKGVSSTLLFNDKGALLTSAGDVSHEQIISAIMANIWKSYTEVQSNIHFMLVDCEEGILGVSSIGRFRLCMHSKNYDFPPGLLKAKVERIVAKLDKSLSSVF